MSEPISLTTALASFAELWSPRIVTRVNDHDIRVAKVRGEHIWHTHDHTDEFFLVLDGELTITLRDRVVVLHRGDVFTVPRGTEHKPSSASGASILMVEPTGTVTVGDQHEEAGGHLDATAGHVL